MDGPPLRLTVPRAAAATALEAVLAGADLDSALAGARAGIAPRDAPLVQELVYGVLRHFHGLARRRDALLSRPGPIGSRPVELVLAVALYELAALSTPPHAVVHEAVQAARECGAGWAAALVNAVLRRALREGPVELDGAARDEYPAWLRRRIERDWAAEAGAVFAAGLARPPLALRVNRLRTSRTDYLDRLAAAGVAARPGAHSPDCVVLDEPRPVSAIPGFVEGEVSVQDEAAQLAAALLAPEPGALVLDACAAPGGKTCHLLERFPELARLLALDRDAARLGPLRANLGRLGLEAQVAAGDAARPQTWWDGRPFDRILLDAPCTATGGMRRHPDIRLAGRAADAGRAARRQGALLAALWPLLAPGGRLLYATCSVLRSENEDVVESFLHATPDAAAAPPSADWGRPAGAGRQILPGESGMDGFFYAVIIKRRE